MRNLYNSHKNALPYFSDHENALKITFLSKTDCAFYGPVRLMYELIALY